MDVIFCGCGGLTECLSVSVFEVCLVLVSPHLCHALAYCPVLLELVFVFSSLCLSCSVILSFDLFTFLYVCNVTLHVQQTQTHVMYLLNENYGTECISWCVHLFVLSDSEERSV